METLRRIFVSILIENDGVALDQHLQEFVIFSNLFGGFPSRCIREQTSHPNKSQVRRSHHILFAKMAHPERMDILNTLTAINSEDNFLLTGADDLSEISVFGNMGRLRSASI